MCGIVSVIQKNWDSSISYSANKMFKQMLFANALRGTDGTGMFWKDTKKNQVFFNKVAAPSWVAIPELTELSTLSMCANWVVGHNRKSTMGIHTYENTHPFNEEHIVLVHNGTLSNQVELEKETGKCAVDSQAITKLLAKNKPKQALEKLEGAYALVWYNTNESKLYYARNKERPLWLVESEQYYFLVSEAELAHWIAARNDIEITKTTEVPAGKIYSLAVNKNNKLQTSVTTFTPKEKKPDLYKYNYDEYNYYNPAYKVPQVYNKKPEPIKWFTPGDTVTFNVISTYMINGVLKLRGRTIDKPVYQVEAIVTDNNIITQKFGTVMEGIITKVKFEFNSWVIECENALPQITQYKTEDGFIITDRILNQLDTKECVACNATPPNDYDNACIYFNIKTQEHEFLCPTCNKLNFTGDIKKYGTA